jgi:chaperonin GroEL
VETSKSFETTVDRAEGLQFDNGFLSPYFVTNPAAMEAAYDDEVKILVVEKRIANMKEITPIVEKVMKVGNGKALLIIAEDIEGEALAVLAVNSHRKVAKIIAVKAPSFGDRRRAMLEDIAILTGAKFIGQELGFKLETLKVEDLGTARRVVATQTTTTIIDGKGDPAKLKERVESITALIEASTVEADIEFLKQRRAKLSGGVAILHVGAATEPEMEEKKARIDDALHATRAALQEGIVPGGGIALFRAKTGLDDLTLSSDEMVGVGIISKALEAPLRTILGNAGISADGVLVGLKTSHDSRSVGMNAATGAYVDMVSVGIIDPTKVTRLALQNAASIAGLMLTTEFMVTEAPEKKDE